MTLVDIVEISYSAKTKAVALAKAALRHGCEDGDDISEMALGVLRALGVKIHDRGPGWPHLAEACITPMCVSNPGHRKWKREQQKERDRQRDVEARRAAGFANARKDPEYMADLMARRKHTSELAKKARAEAE